ncbi:MAG TPA: regulatory protein RecX [Mycobacteriales bacterium]|nr:regulatory protein RecX [Mycobacteriales bacterium]
MTTEASRGSDPADLDADPESVARTIALRLLERQPRTRAELERAMARRDVPPDVAAAVLDRFTDVGLVDDQAFAQAWVDSRHQGRGLARRALSAELRRRGVGDDVIREAVSGVSTDDEEAAARALVARRLPAMARLARETQTRRLVGMLGRKGFSPGLAMKVVREALSAAD